MIIYNETKSQFLDDVDRNRLQPRLEGAFQTMTGSIPSDRSVWADEYSRFAMALGKARVDDDIRVAIEYHISAAGRFRIDALLAGSDGEQDNGLIIELKAWDRADATDIEGMVFAPVGGGKVAEHPSLQASKYRGLILKFNQDVREQNIGLHPAAYLFNLHRRDPEPLEDPRYSDILQEAKLFLAGDVDSLRRHIEAVVPKKPKKDLLFLLENGKLRPADELIARVSSMLDGNEEFLLMDEQNVAFQVIRKGLLPGKAKGGREVFIVEGGPGTGKSVIAVRLVAEILKQKRMGFFVAPNRAFRETLVEYLAKGNRGYREDGQALFLSSWSFHEADWDKENRYEVLIVDEAHRLKTSAHMYKGKNMVEDLVRAAKVTVFFVDETQQVQWADIGSVAEIKKAAAKYGARCHPPMKLAAQFRCNGSDAYLNWLDDTLQIRSTADYDRWGDTQYEFKVFDQAEDLYKALLAKNQNNKARLVAGYSWEWPSQGRRRGTTAAHVEADSLRLPWNFDGENWATSKDGISQAGCIHTSQGLEFDWLGVLIGGDLIYRDERVKGDVSKRAKTDGSLKGWKRDLKAAEDDSVAQQVVLDRVDLIIKSTYKVLLSRGRMGCYVWCADPALRDYFKARLALVMSANPARVDFEESAKAIDRSAPRPSIPFKEISGPDLVPHGNALPLVNLKLAAGAFSGTQSLDLDEVIWVEPPGLIKPVPGLFIAQVVGESMNLRIPNGAWCLFRMAPGGTRQGKVVLAQHRSIDDPELGGQYTVKLYRSEKAFSDDGGWKHLRVTLSPDSTGAGFVPIEILDGESGVAVIAELVMVFD